MARRRLPSRSTNSSAEFIACMNEIKSKNIEEISRELNRLYPGRQNQDIRERKKDVWDQIISAADSIITLADFIPSIQNWKRETRDIIEEYQMIASSQNLNDLKIFHSSLLTFFRKLQREQVSRNPTAPLPSRTAALSPNLEVRDIGFNNIDATDEAIAKLDHFENTAVYMRSDTVAYSRSKFHELDELLFDRKAYLNSHGFPSSRIDASSSFVALAAPSLEGKTQSAFVFRRVRPLYFAMSTTVSYTDDSIPISRQRIYENYSGVTNALHRFAENDLAKIPNVPIGSEYIKSNLSEMHSEALGFLVALVNDAGRPEVQSQPWMRYHSTRPNFTFNSIRIGDMINRTNFFKGFVLFLDEFVGEKWAIFVRNLARAIGLTCLVANTNTKVANLVGRQSSSRSSGAQVFSIVITSLSPASLNLLDRNYQLISSIETINQNSIDPGVKLFFQNFVDVQLKYLSPGLSSFTAEVIRDFANKRHRGINLRMLLDEVIGSVAQELGSRKFLDPSDLISQCAKVGLLLPESYNQTLDISGHGWFCEGFSFLQNHLYHLVKPVQPESWIFLTCPPAPSSKLLRIINNNLQYKSWKQERTFFKAEEKTTILACLFLPFGNPVTDFLNRSRISHSNSPFIVFDAANQRALKLPGNPLEVSAAVSIVDSSQHSFANASRRNHTEIFSLGGQSGITFMKNLILNMIIEEEFLREDSNINVNIGRFECNLNSFFQKMHVPFLYSLGRNDTFFNRLNHVSDSIYLKPYVRTGDRTQIDGKFEFKFDGRTCTAIVECKNRAKKIGSEILEKIIDNALDTRNSKIVFVFCTETIQTPRSNSKFTITCEAKEVNVYRVKQIRGHSYEIVPFFEKFKSPKLICILLESKQIN